MLVDSYFRGGSTTSGHRHERIWWSKELGEKDSFGSSHLWHGSIWLGEIWRDRRRGTWRWMEMGLFSSARLRTWRFQDVSLLVEFFSGFYFVAWTNALICTPFLKNKPIVQSVGSSGLTQLVAMLATCGFVFMVIYRMLLAEWILCSCYPAGRRLIGKAREDPSPFNHVGSKYFEKKVSSGLYCFICSCLYGNILLCLLLGVSYLP